MMLMFSYEVFGSRAIVFTPGNSCLSWSRSFGSEMPGQISTALPPWQFLVLPSKLDKSIVAMGPRACQETDRKIHSTIYILGTNRNEFIGSQRKQMKPDYIRCIVSAAWMHLTVAVSLTEPSLCQEVSLHIPSASLSWPI